MNDNNVLQAVGTLSAKQPDVYNVGDSIKLINYGYSLGRYNEGGIINNGQQIIEVEVKSVQTAKIILE